MNFPSYLYTIVPGQGFGPTKPQQHYGLPIPCATYEPRDPDAEARWGRPTQSQIYLGPEPPEELWLHGAKSGSLLVLYSGDTRDASQYGYAVLNLWPLCGVSAVVTHGDGREVHVGESAVNQVPPPEVAALIVGKALAGAWLEHPRIVAHGPSWALDVLAAIPGAVVYTAKYHRNDKGTCTAWGRRWTIDNGLSPYQVAQRLSWRAPFTFAAPASGYNRTIGSLILGGYRKQIRVPAIAEGTDHWRVEHAELGSILIHAARDRYNNDEPARWPSADDPWLVKLVGDGEPANPANDADRAHDEL